MPLALGQLCTNAKLGVSETFIEPFTPYLLMHPSNLGFSRAKDSGTEPLTFRSVDERATF